jgi:hypothetical protein
MNLAEYQHVVNSTADEFAATGLPIQSLFPWQILKQNRMYELPVNVVPTLDDLGESPVTRMQGFLKTMQKEMDEGLEILAVLCFREWMVRGVAISEDAITGLVTKIGINDEKAANRTIAFMQKFAASSDLVELDRQTLVMLADWLGDVNVYLNSEALKYGLPMEAVLACIMGSNFTKLGTDGLPIKDENGKFLKGPNFVAPEGHIYATLFESDALFDEATAQQENVNRNNTIALPILMNPLAEVLATEAEPEDDYVDPDAGEDEEADADAGPDLFNEGV